MIHKPCLLLSIFLYSIARMHCLKLALKMSSLTSNSLTRTLHLTFQFSWSSAINVLSRSWKIFCFFCFIFSEEPTHLDSNMLKFYQFYSNVVPLAIIELCRTFFLTYSSLHYHRLHAVVFGPVYHYSNNVVSYKDSSF